MLTVSVLVMLVVDSAVETDLYSVVTIVDNPIHTYCLRSRHYYH